MPSRRIERGNLGSKINIPRPRVGNLPWQPAGRRWRETCATLRCHRQIAQGENDHFSRIAVGLVFPISSGMSGVSSQHMIETLDCLFVRSITLCLCQPAVAANMVSMRSFNNEQNHPKLATDDSDILSCPNVIGKQVAFGHRHRVSDDEAAPALSSLPAEEAWDRSSSP